MNQHIQMELDDYRQYFGVRCDDFIAKHNVHSTQIQENVRYEKLTDTTCVELADGEFFYFKDGQLLLIYISGDTLPDQVWSEFKRSVNIKTPEKTVRSRAGKTSRQLVFATHGLTASISRDEIHFIEIYPPCPAEYYLGHIYEEPQPFIR